MNDHDSHAGVNNYFDDLLVTQRAGSHTLSQPAPSRGYAASGASGPPSTQHWANSMRGESPSADLTNEEDLSQLNTARDAAYAGFNLVSGYIERPKADLRLLTEMGEQFDMASAVCKAVTDRETEFRNKGWTKALYKEVRSEASSALRVAKREMQDVKNRVHREGTLRSTKASKALARKEGRSGLDATQMTDMVNSRVEALYAAHAPPSSAAQSESLAGSARGGAGRTEG
jgi:hypothetical protein